MLRLRRRERLRPPDLPECNGRGQVSSQQRTPFGVISTSKVCRAAMAKEPSFKSLAPNAAAAAIFGRRIKWK